VGDDYGTVKPFLWKGNVRPIDRAGGQGYDAPVISPITPCPGFGPIEEAGRMAR